MFVIETAWRLKKLLSKFINKFVRSYTFFGFDKYVSSPKENKVIRWSRYINFSLTCVKRGIHFSESSYNEQPV